MSASDPTPSMREPVDSRHVDRPPPIDPTTTTNQSNHPYDTQVTPVSRNLYRGKPIDRSIPPIPSSQLLSIPSIRRGRRFRENPTDLHSTRFYGDAVIQKDPSSIRFFFQNVKGLTYSNSSEDYPYFLSCTKGDWCLAQWLILFTSVVRTWGRILLGQF